MGAGLRDRNMAGYGWHCLLLLGLLTGCTDMAAVDVPASAAASVPTPATTSASPAVDEPLARVASPVGGVFGPGSVWKVDVSSAPVAADSPAMVAGLAKQVATHFGSAAFNVHQFNTTFYVADPGTVRRRIGFHDCQRKGHVPRQLYDCMRGAHFDGVPIPDGAVPAAGTDAELTVWNPATDQLWEFWKAKRTATGWQACWGGRIDRVSRSPGFFRHGMGATATGLPNAGGMVGIRDAQLGHIRHALSLQLVDTDGWQRFSWPAQRSDGHNPRNLPHRIPEGTRLRLDPNLDVAALPLHPLARMIARAAQRYGFIVTDKGGAVAVLAESGAATQAATGNNPWTALLGASPSYAVLRHFPWGSLQALPHNYGSP